MPAHLNTPALQISNLSKTYPNGFSALKGVNLTVPQGDFFALLGANGAGKSTLISIVSSLLQPTAGDVTIFGIDLLKNPSQAKRYLGVVPQEFNFNQFETCLDILLFQAGYFGIAKKTGITSSRIFTNSTRTVGKTPHQKSSVIRRYETAINDCKSFNSSPKVIDFR